jgi:hypothetical protein
VNCKLIYRNTAHFVDFCVKQIIHFGFSLRGAYDVNLSPFLTVGSKDERYQAEGLYGRADIWRENSNKRHE